MVNLPFLSEPLSTFIQHPGLAHISLPFPIAVVSLIKLSDPCKTPTAELSHEKNSGFNKLPFKWPQIPSSD